MTAASTVSIPLPTTDFLALADFLRKNGSDRDPVEAVAIAVDYWMENAAWKAADLMPETVPDADDRGYMWKEAWLPSGTIARMKYGPEFFYAKVEGDFLVYEGQKVSPNQFAYKVAGNSERSAWRDLWIKRPNDSDYVPAESLKKKA
jgi:hypothetical protein